MDARLQFSDVVEWTPQICQSDFVITIQLLTECVYTKLMCNEEELTVYGRKFCTVKRV